LISYPSQSDDLKSLAGAALAATVTGEKYPSTKDIVNKLKKLMEPDGTFRSSESSSASSILNTRIAMEVISEYSDQATRFTVAEIIETVIKLLPSGDDNNRVDPLLLSYLRKSSDDKFKLNSVQLEVISNSVLSLLHSTRDLRTVSLGLDSLAVVSTYKAQPIFSYLSPEYLSIESIQSVSIHAVDVLGNKLDISAVDVKSLRPLGAVKEGPSKDSNLFASKLEPGDEGLFSIDLESIALSPGVFVLTYSLQIANRKASLTFEKYITLTAEAEFTNLWFGITEAKQVHLSDLTPLPRPGSISGVSGSSTAADYIHVAFTVQAKGRSDKGIRRPHQAFVKFVHANTSTVTVFTALTSDAADSFTATSSSIKYQLGISLSDEVETFLHLSGAYSVEILVGDPALAHPLEWTVGEVELTFPAKVKKELPLYVQSLLAASDNSLTTLPEIAHKMREPAKRASAITSTLFTALALVPLLVLVVFLLRLKPNLKRLQSPYSILFALGILGTLVLYAAYWLGYSGASFYDTIKYLCLLAPVLLIIGRGSLASITAARLAENKSE